MLPAHRALPACASQSEVLVSPAVHAAVAVQRTKCKLENVWLQTCGADGYDISLIFLDAPLSPTALPIGYLDQLNNKPEALETAGYPGARLSCCVCCNCVVPVNSANVQVLFSLSNTGPALSPVACRAGDKARLHPAACCTPSLAPRLVLCDLCCLPPTTCRAQLGCLPLVKLG